MTFEKFEKKTEETEDWAPGWNAVENEFEKLYPNTEPLHYATDMTKRAIFGGNQFLDGYSFLQIVKRLLASCYIRHDSPLCRKRRIRRRME